MSESEIAEAICRHGRSLFDRGLTHGRTGNISVRLDDGRLLVTPTGSCLGTLTPVGLSRLGADGEHLGGDPPTKEAFLHLAVYAARPGTAAVVHLHSTYSVAVSCLDGLDPANALPPLTAYYAMRVGRLPLIPYYAPGDRGLADAVGRGAARDHAMLLANHGPVTAGASLDAAVDCIEELEQTAKLYLLLRRERTRPLDAGQVAALNDRRGESPRGT